MPIIVKMNNGAITKLGTPTSAKMRRKAVTTTDVMRTRRGAGKAID
jgi:hypothetical protein